MYNYSDENTHKKQAIRQGSISYISTNVIRFRGLMKNIWQELNKPFFVLAPMDDVTDTVFRRVVADTAKPDVFFTEFANADGLQSAGREAVFRKLKHTDSEKPLIAQLWGMKPENYEKTTSELVGMRFDGVDLNMGCPVRNVIKLGACSALINDRELSAEIISATKKGANGRIPVSVKTRVGFSEVDMSWVEFLLEQEIDALTVHGRTTKQQSKVPNDWSLIGETVKIRDRIASETVIIGNGDVISRQRGEELAQEYGVDGIMIGRGVFKDPYVFSENSPWKRMSSEEKIRLYIKHIKLFEKEWGGQKNPVGLKKFAKVYINGFDGASGLRSKLMNCDDTDTMLQVIENA